MLGLKCKNKQISFFLQRIDYAFITHLLRTCYLFAIFLLFMEEFEFA